MKNLTTVTTLLALAFVSQALFAQDLPNPSVVTKEHKWLAQFVGEWDVVAESPTGEGKPPMKGKALMKSSMLGELWVVNSSDHEVEG